jgi:hypothetical protein
MKRVLILLVLFLLACKSKKTNTYSFNENKALGFNVNAQVSKIDSVANYYLVFIENETNFFKIISNKNQIKPYKGVKLKVGENYMFKIFQLTDRKNLKLNSQFSPVNYLDIDQCLRFEGTEICTESSFELATSNNLKGLYLLR